MPIQDYVDEFKKNYEKPQVDDIIVGFSGIDPQRKGTGSSSSSSDSTRLTEEQEDQVRELIQTEIDQINTTGHECGCNPNGLSNTQMVIVNNIIDEKLKNFEISYDAGDVSDPDPTTDPTPTPDPEPIIVNPIDMNHELLDGLYGGNSEGHYHLTGKELLKIAAYPEYKETKHESLSDLLGGNSNGHYHLTGYEFKKLQIMIETFFPDGTDNIIIKALSPENPDNPDDDDEDPHGGLPSGTPPDWELRMLPSGYEACEYSPKMLYTDGNLLPDEPHDDGKLYAKFKKTGSQTWVVFRTNTLDTWDEVSYIFPGKNNPVNFVQAFKSYGAVNKSSPEEVVFINNPNVPSRAYDEHQATIVNSKCIAGCYSPSLQSVILVSSDNQYVYKKEYDQSRKSIRFYGELTVNSGCAAWHPVSAVFCLTGLEGTSTSRDGEEWALNTNAPHNLVELTYREDLGFFARSAEDKTFYASHDGINWQQVNNTPIPLADVTAVHYSPELQWYCAVGTGDGNAYFSKDLEHWVPAKLRNNTPVDVADVIYMPSTGLFVAMPTEGTYYYTFNPSSWTD